MGREHRLSRDPRLREESDRRPSRVPVALPRKAARLGIGAGRPIVGIDVGEDFLDLAILAGRKLRFERVTLTSCGQDPIATLAGRLEEAAPELRHDAIALVDSPCIFFHPDSATPAGSRQRDLDAMLQAAVSQINRVRAASTPGSQVRLSLFPTPSREYFIACATRQDCKPHLIEIAGALLGLIPDKTSRPIRGGGPLFTRFMLSGFAAFHALERLRVESFESYPYVVFALWKKPEERLPAKYPRGAALTARQAIIARVAADTQVDVPSPRTLDQADAAVLAIATHLAAKRSRSVVAFESIAHGRFLLPLSAPDLAAMTFPATSGA